MDIKKEDVKFLIIGTILIALVFGFLYYLTDKNYKKETTPKENTEEVTINYDEVFYGNYKNKKHKEYYVYLFNKNTETDVKTIIVNYKTKEDIVPIYYLNSDLKINKDILKLDEEIKDEALIVIKNKKVKDIITNKTEIANKLK